MAVRLRRVNRAAGAAFVLGGSLFALGAWIAQVGSGYAVTSASIYLAGGLFFSLGGYASLLLASNTPADSSRRLTAASRWRWWSYQPTWLTWLAAFVLFAGTLAFGISLISAFIEGLSVRQQNRLIWAPDMAGCILFLISGRLAMDAVRRGGRWLQPGRPGWWVAAVNQLGSALFFVAGVAAFVRPATESVANVDIANWGTFLGAVCFALGGVLQGLSQPGT